MCLAIKTHAFCPHGVVMCFVCDFENRDYWPKTASTAPVVVVETRFAVSGVGPVSLFMFYIVYHLYCLHFMYFL